MTRTRTKPPTPVTLRITRADLPGYVVGTFYRPNGRAVIYDGRPLQTGLYPVDQVRELVDSALRYWIGRLRRDLTLDRVEGIE